MSNSNDRISFVLPWGFTLGGSNTWSVEMCRRLSAQNRPCALIEHVTPSETTVEGWSIPAGVRVARCEGKPPAQAQARDLKGYRPIYQSVLPGVIVPNQFDAPYATCAQLSGRFAEQMRVIGITHGSQEPIYNTIVYYEPLIHLIISVSDEVTAELRRRIPHRANDIHTRACAVKMADQLKRGYSTAPVPLQLIYAGRITNYDKSVGQLLVLARELQQRRVDFRMRIIGEGPFKNSLVNEHLPQLEPDVRRKISVEAAVTPIGMSDVWRSADVCVLVSDSEGTSVSMLEAMGQGCVPVVTKVSGTQAVIRHGGNGYMVPVRDMKAMAEVIGHLDRRREELQAVGMRAYEAVREKYSFESYVPWFLERVEETWRQPPRVWPRFRPVLPPGSPHVPWNNLISRAGSIWRNMRAS